MLFRKLPRSTWKRLKTIAVALMLIFAAYAFMHDDRHPESLSEAEKAYVLTTLKQVDQHIVQVTERMEQFMADPENATDRVDALTEALNRWVATSNKAEVTPAFYYDLNPEDKSDFVIECRVVNERIMSRIENELGQATSRMAQELVDRGDSIDLEHESFARLRKTLINMSDRPKSGPCDHQACFWCRVRKAWLHRNDAISLSAN